jgi:hypothetical protein
VLTSRGAGAAAASLLKGLDSGLRVNNLGHDQLHTFGIVEIMGKQSTSPRHRNIRKADRCAQAGRAYSEEQRNTVRALLEGGTDEETIEKETGVSDRTIRRWKLELERTGRIGKPPESRTGRHRVLTKEVEEVSGDACFRCCAGAICDATRLDSGTC